LTPDQTDDEIEAEVQNSLQNIFFDGSAVIETKDTARVDDGAWRVYVCVDTHGMISPLWFPCFVHDAKDADDAERIAAKQVMRMAEFNWRIV
jgi:hypothetical protein